MRSGKLDDVSSRTDNLLSACILCLASRLIASVNQHGKVWFVCGWQIKLCDPLVTHGHLSALETGLHVGHYKALYKFIFFYYTFLLYTVASVPKQPGLNSLPPLGRSFKLPLPKISSFILKVTVHILCTNRHSVTRGANRYPGHDSPNGSICRALSPGDLGALPTEADKKLSYRIETVRLHDRTSSSAGAEKKHCRVDQFWVSGR